MLSVLAGVGVLAWTGGPRCACKRPLPPNDHHSLPSRLGAEALYHELVRRRAFMGYTLTGAFQFGALFSFLSGSALCCHPAPAELSHVSSELIFGAQVVLS